MAMFIFTKSILEEKPISLYNFGDMERDFTFIDDIIEGTRLAIKIKVRINYLTWVIIIVSI